MSTESLEVQIKELEAKIQSQQAIIDELMLEHCPGDMTKEQMDEWARHQRPVTKEEERRIEKALKWNELWRESRPSATKQL